MTPAGARRRQDRSRHLVVDAVAVAVLLLANKYQPSRLSSNLISELLQGRRDLIR